MRRAIKEEGLVKHTNGSNCSEAKGQDQEGKWGDMTSCRGSGKGLAVSNV